MPTAAASSAGRDHGASVRGATRHETTASRAAPTITRAAPTATGDASGPSARAVPVVPKATAARRTSIRAMFGADCSTIPLLHQGEPDVVARDRAEEHRVQAIQGAAMRPEEPSRVLHPAVALDVGLE